ncbi:hypothetical protein N8T08_008231 [Aspergillus melleus]|uniref:Uncharacterized protein n=1 Tax=Aspergillus melleus TaxID=138277 RepID=A0ACC3AWJ9_9EURO|nr:hypothetical protein N8T08_008231 [Aspergillus melleus]
MKITRCGIHGFHETLGIDAEELRFYWTITSDAPNTQSAYEITISKDASTFNQEAPLETSVFWTTGKVTSAEQRNILCKPSGGFESITSYFWRVTVWDESENVYLSAMNHFFTSYPRSRLLPPYSMNQTYMPHSSLIFRTWFENEHDRWKAVWIGDGGDKPIYLRKSFKLSARPVRAILFASGLGHFNMSVNGSTASAHVLDPGWTNYHRRVQFTAYDVTEHLSAGENILGAHVGNGFYAGDQGDRFFWPMYEDNTYVRYGNELCFFGELHTFYEDGSHAVMISDPSWKVRKSATTLANIYASETHDRRAYPAGWDNVSFDDEQWAPAKPLTGPRGFLYYQSQPPVVLHDTFHPVKVYSPTKDTVCYDLGQNASTMVKIEVSGPAGAEVIIRYAETVKEDGTVLMPDPLFKQFETGVYSKFYLSGSGVETWEPDFSFTSARYIQVEGVSLSANDRLPVIHSAVGRHVSSGARNLGTMTTDKEDTNALLNALYWTFSSNLFSYHTDCPQIEKFGWLEVTHLLAPATQYVRDMESLYTKILDDILDAQEPSGLVPTMAPEIRYMCGPLHDTITWGCAVCLLPDILRKYYGSTHVIPRVYPAAVRYMEYMQKKERKGGLIEHGLGDWGRDIAFGNHQANIETAVYYRCLCCVEGMARELGLSDEAGKYSRWAERVRTVYNQHLLVTDTSEYGYAYYTSLDNYPARDRTAVNQGVALQFGLVSDAHREDVMKAFLADTSDGRMRAGEIGLPFLFSTLADAKRPDLVLQMARQEEHPSYMRFLRRGETTLLEFWQDECRSKCHDMLGTIYEWFYRAVLGLRTLEDAYRRFEIDPPYTAEFGHVKGSVECPYGVIAVEFTRGDGEVKLDVKVPFGTVGVVRVPEGRKAEVVKKGNSEGKLYSHDVDLSHGVYSITVRE